MQRLSNASKDSRVQLRFPIVCNTCRTSQSHGKLSIDNKMLNSTNLLADKTATDEYDEDDDDVDEDADDLCDDDRR